MSESSQGQIITFYSYKGGTGRTMALANVAWILASSEKRVLCVDWDLESPGLHKFFHPFLNESTVSATPGVIEIIPLLCAPWTGTTSTTGWAEADSSVRCARI